MSKTITREFIIQKDTELMKLGISLHARPFHVNLAWMEYAGINGNVVDEERRKIIENVYDEIYPPKSTNMPPLFTGGAAIRDNVYLVEVPIIFGSVHIEPIKQIQIEPAELEKIYKNFPEDFWNALYQSADALDFGYSIDDLTKANDNDFLRNAATNLTAAFRTLLGKRDIDAALQSACLTIELAGKGILKEEKYSNEQLKAMGHNLVRITKEVIKIKPSKDDNEVLNVVAKLPNYVQSRYSKTNMTKLELVNTAVNVQFAAASLLRRFTGRNLASDIAASTDTPARKLP
ncbi:MAG: hypothetical protein LCH83_13615 [Proteobacteria bacterium]|nr:hypothetical protein [Pseudomonadota bacterium]